MYIAFDPKHRGVKLVFARCDQDALSRCFSTHEPLSVPANSVFNESEVSILSLQVLEDFEPGLLAEVNDDKIILRGDKKSLQWLLREITEFLSEDLTRESHIHLENFEGHLYFRQQSLSLIIEWDEN